MTTRLPAFIFSSLVLSFATAGLAATTNDSDALQFYDVEVVIFKNTNVPKNREYVLPVSSPRIEQPILDLSSPQSIEQAKIYSYELLSYNDLKLLDTVRKIIDSSRYELLMHTGWRQPGLEKDRVLPIWIKGGRFFGNEYTSIDNSIAMEAAKQNVAEYSDGVIILDQVAESPPPESTQDGQGVDNNASLSQAPKGLYELEGTISVALSRYLHTYADLVLRRPRVPLDAILEDATTEQLMAQNNPDARILNNHILKEQRRMRSNTLHYLDNPEFSMLVLITPSEGAAVATPLNEQSKGDEPELKTETGTDIQ